MIQADYLTQASSIVRAALYYGWLRAWFQLALPRSESVS